MDGLIAVAMSGILVGVSWWGGLAWWAWFWGVITVVLGIFEWLAKKYTNKTISQQFWKQRRLHPTRTWIVFGVYALFFAFLLIHLSGVF